MTPFEMNGWYNLKILVKTSNYLDLFVSGKVKRKFLRLKFSIDEYSHTTCTNDVNLCKINLL